MLDRNQWIAIGLVSGLAYILGKDRESSGAEVEAETFVCVRSGKTEYMDKGFLVPNLGMVSENHMTKEDWEAWDKQNALYNPDSYSREQLKEWGLFVEEQGAESFNAPYAGSGSLMGIKQDTSIGDFSAKELTESSAIHGDFNEASLNYSGHQNIQVRGSESFEADTYKVVLRKPNEFRDFPYIAKVSVRDDEAMKEAGSGPYGDASMENMKRSNANGQMHDASIMKLRVITNEDLQELSQSERELFMETYFDSITQKLNNIRKTILESEMNAESFEAEKKNCGCGQDPCVTYGAEPCEGESFEADGDNFAEIENLLDSNDDIFLGTGDGFKPDHPNREEIIAYLTQGGGGQTPYRVCFTCSRVTPDWVTIDEGYECFPCADQ